MSICVKRLVTLLLSLSSLACSGGSCGGGASSTSASASQQVSLLMSDSAVQELSSFVVTIREIRPIVAGSLGSNVLTAPISLDLLSYQGSYKLSGNFGVPTGTTGVEVSIDSNSIEAKKEDGSAATVQTLTSSDSDSLSKPLSKGTKSISLEFPIAENLDLQGDGSYNYSFEVNVVNAEESESPAEGPDVSDLVGRVVSQSPAARSFSLAVRNDEDSEFEFGAVTVQIDDSTKLVEEDGLAFNSTANFFAALQNGELAEVEGSLQSDGSLLAESVILQDPLISTKIRGTVAKLSPTDANSGILTLQINYVGKGVARVRQLLDPLGNPASIDVAYDASTQIYLHARDGGATDPTQLQVGQHITARFRSSLFADSPPFLASSIVIHKWGVPFEAQISSLAGLPNTIAVTVRPGHPAIQRALLTNPVTVDLADPSLKLFLGMPWVFPLTMSDLQVGQLVRVHGRIDGSSPNTIDATAMRVHAGTLVGQVGSEQAALNSFELSSAQVSLPFDDASLSFPLTVRLHTPAVLRGPAGVRLTPSLFFQRLDPGGTVRVRGIAGIGGSVLAYKVRILP